MHVSHCHISWAQNKLSRRCRRLLQALPQTSHTTWLISLWLSETLGFRSPCCQKHVMYLLQTSFLLRVREDLSQIIALHGGWLLAALIQSDYQRMGWFDIIYFVLMVYVLIHFLPLCPDTATAGKQGGLTSDGLTLSHPYCWNKKGFLSENGLGLVHICFSDKPPIAIFCSLLQICLNIAIIKNIYN